MNTSRGYHTATSASAGPPRPHQIISSCCCDCIRLNSHLLADQKSNHRNHNHGTRSYSDSDTCSSDSEEMYAYARPTFHPSACFNVHMDEKRRFFEHLNDLSEDECLEYCRRCCAGAGAKHQRPKYPPRHTRTWRNYKPQQRHMKYPPSHGLPRPQKHNHNQHAHDCCHPEVQARCRPPQGANVEQQRFYQTQANRETFHRQYSLSDMEYTRRPRTTAGQTTMHQPPFDVDDRRKYLFDYLGDRPPYEVIDLWRRPKTLGGADFDDSRDANINPGQNHPKPKLPLAKSQSSRDFLKSIQVVTNTRAHFEERIANDPSFKRAILQQQARASRGTRGERSPTENLPKDDHDQEQVPRTNSLANRAQEEGGRNPEEVSTSPQEIPVTARHSHSSPMLATHKNNGDSNEVRRKSKSVPWPRPGPGKFKHPQYEDLNLSGMRIPELIPGSNSGELKVLKAKDADYPDTVDERKDSGGNTTGGGLEKKYFDDWKSRTIRRYTIPERKTSALKDGLLVLTQSKSQQEITTREFGRIKIAVTPESTKSAPPQTEPTRWFAFLDSVNPWAPTAAAVTRPEEQLDNGVSAVLEQQPQPPDATLVDVDFAIEVDAKVPTERATSVTNATEEALRRMSEDYDNTVVASTRKESLDVHDSNLAFNSSLENLGHEWRAKTKARRSTKSQTFIQKKQTHLAEKKTVIGHRICHFCKQLITEPVEPHKVIQVQGRNMFWHRGCFKCARCETLLDSQHHYFWKGNVYCTEHYANIARVPRCHACHEYIFDSTITLAMGSTWHKHHFQCLNCKRPLIDTKFVKIGSDSAICFECQQKLYSKKCIFCGQPILPTEVYVRSGNCFWHSNDTCLNCQTCHRNLSHDTKIFVRHGRTYCNRYCAQMNVSPAIALSHENPELPV